MQWYEIGVKQTVKGDNHFLPDDKVVVGVVVELVVVLGVVVLAVLVGVVLVVAKSNKH